MGTNISKIVGGVASVSITILVECFIWTKIRKNNTVLDQIKNAKPVEYGDQNTQDYAQVEGFVSRTSEKQEIVLKKSQSTMKEIIWSLFLSNLYGRWSDAENLETQPFHLDNKSMRVFVRDPSTATYMNVMLGLRILIKAAVGEHDKGKTDLELKLPFGTRLVGFGKVTCTDNTTEIGPPVSSKGCFILTGMSREDLIKSFKDKILLLKVIGFVTLLIGGGITTYIIYSCKRRRRVNAQHNDAPQE